MTFEITQLWRQITGSSLQGPQLSSLRQMFTFEPMTSQSALLFLSSLTTRAVKRAHTCFWKLMAWVKEKLGPLMRKRVYCPFHLSSAWGQHVQFWNSWRRVYLSSGNICVGRGHGPWRLLWSFRTTETWRSASTEFLACCDSFQGPLKNDLQQRAWLKRLFVQ